MSPSVTLYLAVYSDAESLDDSAAHWLVWPTRVLRDPAVSASCTRALNTGYHYVWPLCGCWDPNPGLHVYMASTLLTKPSLHI